ncbi:YoaK family protein [Mesorhizobium sp. YM1C-6-2]|uniref:YoaK family protein n=1 Tax=Mesorhizobium sp. YM1C-6-2 TaxID=1827501 RepID=UPI001AEC786C|nr:YoaK family protein [Mesorhizobium sp. YM1C-6-2]
MAVALSLLAGFVDALGFMHLGGYFVSFMSGNSTQMAAVLPDGLAGAILPLALVVLFVLGVMVGTLAEQRLSASLGLLVLAALLGVATALAAMRLDDAAIMVTPFVMGAMNTVLRSGQGAMAVTYMTGNLVKLGQTIVAAVQGGPRWAWLPYLLLWLGLLVGALCGALAYGEIGLVALWLPAVGLIGLAFMKLAPR